MTKQSTLQSIPLILIGIALLFAIHFKGTAYNLLYMTIASFLLIASACYGLHHHIIKKQIAISFKLPHIVCFIWIIWLFISINWSYSPSNSWHYSWILAALPFSFLLWSWIKPLCNQQVAFNGLLVITLFYALWAIVEFILTASSTKGPTLYQGVFGSLFAATVIPVISQYISNTPQRIVNRHLVVIIILLLALFSTFSRGTMLSYLMVLPLLFFSAYKQQLPIAKNATVILITTISCFFVISQYSELFSDQLMSNKVGSEAGLHTMGQRFKLYRSMLEIYQDYPILGTGLATFKIFYRSYRDPTETSSGNFGHNDYLQYLQEGGPVLLSFLLMALALIAWVLYSSTFKTKTSLQTTGFALASATLFIHAAADIVLYSYALILLAGLYLSMSYHNLVTPDNKAIKLDRPKLTAGVIVFGLFLGWLGLAIDTRINTHLKWQHLWGKDYQASVADLQTLENYHNLRPKNPEPLVRLAEFYLFMAKDVKTDKEKLAMANPALFYTLKLIEISPRFSRMYLRLAELAALAPALQPAIQRETEVYGINKNANLTEQLLNKAIHLNPNNNMASLTLADYYQQQQNPDKALGILNNALVWLNTPKFMTSIEAYIRNQQHKQQILNKIKQLDASKSYS